MPRFRFRNVLLVALACSLTAPTSDAQQSRTRKKKKSSVVQPRRKKPAKSRSRRAESPIAPVAHYTSPRGAQALANDLGAFLPQIRSGQWGVMVTSVTRGDTLFAYNAGMAMRPASTLKLFTSALVFDRFGTDYQFSTDVLRDGPVSADGTLQGNIIIRGDGDPALSSRFVDGGPDAPMQLLAQQVAEAGIKRITGSVIGDATAFDDQKIPDGWLDRYLGAAYAARVSGLSLAENLVWVAVSPGSGAKATAVLEPATTTISLVNDARTVAGSGAKLRMSKHADGTITVTGTIGRLSGTRRYSYVVDDPAMFVTGAFRAALLAKGVQIGGGTHLGGTPARATRVTHLASPSLARMVSAMNRESINHYAELLFRNGARGPAHEVQGTVEQGNRALRDFFTREVKIDPSSLSSMYAADGSGLSTTNRVTARSMTQLLGYAHMSRWGPAFHASLPLAGKSGTQRTRMRGSPAQGNLHAKTGTTNDVVALAGYVTAVNGEVLAFTFLYNGTDRWTAKSTIDVMGQTLASFAR